MSLRSLAFAAALTSADAFTAVSRPGVAHRAATPSMMLSPADLIDHLEHLPTFSLLAEITDGDGERVYGAVDAPSWVAPVGGIAAVGTGACQPSRDRNAC